MKVLIGAAAAVMMFAAAAAAQTTAPTTTTSPPAATAAASRCPALPATDLTGVPDGATATGEQMAAANTQYSAWSTSLVSVLECRKAEHDELLATLNARRAEYNAGKARLDAGNAAWTAESEEYCARPRMRCERDQ